MESFNQILAVVNIRWDADVGGSTIALLIYKYIVKLKINFIKLSTLGLIVKT